MPIRLPRAVVPAALVAALLIAACSDGDAKPPVAGTASPAPLGTPAATELGRTALGLEDLEQGTSVLAPLHCESKVAPTQGTVGPQETCAVGFRLPDTAAVSYGSYLWESEDLAANSAKTLAPTVASRTPGEASTPPAPPLGDNATLVQVVTQKGDKRETTQIVSFNRGRVVVYLSVVSFGDPAPELDRTARVAYDKLAGHFGG